MKNYRDSRVDLRIMGKAVKVLNSITSVNHLEMAKQFSNLALRHGIRDRFADKWDREVYCSEYREWRAYLQDLMTKAEERVMRLAWLHSCNYPV